MKSIILEVTQSKLLRSIFVMVVLLICILSLTGSQALLFADSYWQMQIVDSAGTVGLMPSAVLDAAGNPHISYSHDNNKDLKFAYWDGEQWQTTTVDTAGGAYSSLALDKAGNPHISYEVKAGDAWAILNHRIL